MLALTCCLTPHKVLVERIGLTLGMPASLDEAVSGTLAGPPELWVRVLLLPPPPGAAEASRGGCGRAACGQVPAQGLPPHRALRLLVPRAPSCTRLWIHM